MHDILRHASRRANLPAVAVAMLLLSACTSSGTVDIPVIGAADVTIRAQSIAFEPQTIKVPAGRSFVLALDNADAGVPHAIAITRSGQQVVESEIGTGPAVIKVAVPALAPGSYQFICPVHPNMTGTIEAG